MDKYYCLNCCKEGMDKEEIIEHQQDDGVIIPVCSQSCKEEIKTRFRYK